MPNATVRANARTLSKTKPHLDAAIFELAEQFSAAGKVLEEAAEAVERAEKRQQKCQRPPVIIRTERDRQLGLFVGNRVGTLYDRADIPALRALMRTDLIIGGDGEDVEVWQRASAILGALRDLIAEEAREKVQSGFIDAMHRQDAAGDAYDDLAERLLKTRAETVDGVFAKARLMGSTSEALERQLRDHLRRFGVDGDAFALSLARDLVLLADRARSPADGEGRS